MRRSTAGAWTCSGERHPSSRDAVGPGLAGLDGAGLDGGRDRRIEALRSDQVGQAAVVELLTQLVGGPGDDEGDVPLVQALDDLTDSLGGTGVDTTDRGCVEHEVTHRLGCGIHRGPQPTLEEVDI